jgi:AraC family transcriptional regulator
MEKNVLPKTQNAQMPLEAPFTTFIQLEGKSAVPSKFHTPAAFTITRLQSSVELPDRITKVSAIPAVLVSVSL